jgi:osmotically-inducible protein OsmY
MKNGTLKRGGRIAIPVIGVAAAGLAVLRDKRRRDMARDRATSLVRRGAGLAGRKADYVAGVAKGITHEATEPMRRADREYDDVTLARKVESELFRGPDVPKGEVSVNVQNGVVELRGEVKRPEQVRALGEAAERVEGVKDVHNLLHTPGSPPKHSPPSDPQEVRERLQASGEGK